MGNEQNIKGPNFWFALVLIIIGILFLLHNFDYIDLGELWQYWPLIFVVIGVMKLIKSRSRDFISSTVFIAIGTSLLLIELDILDWQEIWLFWPIILILLGLLLLFKRFTPLAKVECVSVLKSRISGEDEPAHSGEKNSDNRIDIVAIFSGREHLVNSENFEGGNVTVIFGGVELDLGSAKLSKGKNVIDIFTMFGGVEIFVPKDWQINVTGFPLFGAIEDTRRKAPLEEYPSENVLTVKGFVLFGGIEIKNA